MRQFAPAFVPARSTSIPSAAEAIAAITDAGRTIADLGARLTQAERTIAMLEDEKRGLEAELRASRRGPVRLPRADSVTLPANRSHLDETLAALAEGLGPELVRRTPER